MGLAWTFKQLLKCYTNYKEYKGILHTFNKTFSLLLMSSCRSFSCLSDIISSNGPALQQSSSFVIFKSGSVGVNLSDISITVQCVKQDQPSVTNVSPPSCFLRLSMVQQSPYFMKIFGIFFKVPLILVWTLVLTLTLDITLLNKSANDLLLTFIIIIIIVDNTLTRTSNG